MPLKPVPNQELLTYAEAKAEYDLLASHGYPVSNLVEITQAYGTVSTTDPNYYDDGQPHVFNLDLWGKTMEVGLLKAQIDGGGYNNVLKVAEVAAYTPSPLETYNNAMALILALPGAMPALDAALKL